MKKRIIFILNTFIICCLPFIILSYLQFDSRMVNRYGEQLPEVGWKRYHIQNIDDSVIIKDNISYLRDSKRFPEINKIYAAIVQHYDSLSSNLTSVYLPNNHRFVCFKRNDSCVDLYLFFSERIDFNCPNIKFNVQGYESKLFYHQELLIFQEFENTVLDNVPFKTNGRDYDFWRWVYGYAYLITIASPTILTVLLLLEIYMIVRIYYKKDSNQ